MTEISMHLMKLEIVSGAPKANVATSTHTSPIVVRGKGKQYARLLAGHNFHIASSTRCADGSVPAGIWSDHEFSIVKSLNNPGAEQQAQYDACKANFHLEPVEYPHLKIDGEIVAEMIWWSWDSKRPCPY